MHIHDKKQALMTVMAKRGDKGGPVTAGPVAMKPEISMTEPGEPDGMHAAAQDMIAAHGEKSAEKLSAAMKNWMTLHNSQQAQSPSEE